MEVQLNAYEVLEIAEKIERNGAKFYRRAAQMVDDSHTASVFSKLANWETRHIEVFRDMRERLSEENWALGTFEPTRMDLPDAQVMAGLAVFGVQADPAKELTGGESRADVLRAAILKEKDSIVYYSGLKGFVPHESDKALIDDIIKEEMRHVRILTESLESAQ